VVLTNVSSLTEMVLTGMVFFQRVPGDGVGRGGAYAIQWGRNRRFGVSSAP
jgi:hypothetical protein